jgi:hypothetical protein
MPMAKRLKGFVDAEGLVITPENQLLWSSEAGSPLRKSTLTGKFVEDLSAIFPRAIRLIVKKRIPKGFAAAFPGKDFRLRRITTICM